MSPHYFLQGRAWFYRVQGRALSLGCLCILGLDWISGAYLKVVLYEKHGPFFSIQRNARISLVEKAFISSSVQEKKTFIFPFFPFFSSQIPFCHEFASSTSAKSTSAEGKEAQSVKSLLHMSSQKDKGKGIFPFCTAAHFFTELLPFDFHSVMEFSLVCR